MDQATVARKAPPIVERLGPVRWARENLFSSVSNSLLTLFGLWVLWAVFGGIVEWAIFNASFVGSDRSACMKPEQGACWPFIEAKFGQFIYGRYPIEDRWRVNATFVLMAITILPILMPSLGYKKANLLALLLGLPIASFILLSGGLFGLESVETNLWGGLMVTLVVALTGIVFSLPLGILLALGRRSDLPIIRWLSIGFIEIFRGIPLITVLFMASVMLPLFLPEGVNFDKLVRCLIGVALFASAYMAEVVRAGLESLPKGQYEAAHTQGFGYWQTQRLIILPQALKVVIPGIVNTFIGLFKDTTLVLIVGIFDLLGIVQLNFTDSSWATPQTAITGYFFVALVFWAFCFAMSRYSIFMEHHLSVEQRKDNI